MCKQRVALDAIKATVHDLPEWFLTHAEAQAEDAEMNQKVNEETLEKVDDLNTRVTSLEKTVGRIDTTVGDIKATVDELVALLKKDHVTEKAYVWDSVVGFFKSKKFWMLLLVVLSFCVGAGKDAIIAALGLL